MSDKIKQINSKEQTMSDKIKQKIKCDLAFNHLDPHFARFHVIPDQPAKDESVLYGMRPINISPEMFPADFELANYDITGSLEVTVEIKKKK